MFVFVCVNGFVFVYKNVCLCVLECLCTSVYVFMLLCESFVCMSLFVCVCVFVCMSVYV